MARQIVVDVVGDSSKFNKTTSDAVNGAGRMEKGFKASAVGGLAMGAAFSLVNKGVDFLTDAIGGASEAAKVDTASQDRLQLAYNNTGKAQKLSIAAIEGVITANQAKGVSDDQQRAGISDFLDLTGSSTEAMKLNNATVELAAAKGIEYADAEAMIKSAAAGKTAALKKAGVEIEKGASITEIATQVNDKFGGSLDAMAETEGGKTAIANEKMGEAMEAVGRIINKVAIVIMPLIADAMTFAADVVVPALGAAFDWISKNVMPTIVQSISWFSKNILPSLIQAFRAISPVVANVFGVVGNVIRAVAPVIGAVFGTIGTVIRGFITLIQSIVGIVTTVSGRVGAVFHTMATIIGSAFSAISGVVKGVFNAIIGAINGVIGAINRIQVHIHVGPVGYDFNGLNLGYIPKLHSGGIVPGMPGSDVLTVLQAGERVIPTNQARSGGDIHIHIEQGAYIDGPGIDMLTNRIAQRLRYASGT